MDQTEHCKSIELQENDVNYEDASSYLPDSASTPVKGASGVNAWLTRSTWIKISYMATHA